MLCLCYIISALLILIFSLMFNINNEYYSLTITIAVVSLIQLGVMEQVKRKFK